MAKHLFRDLELLKKELLNLGSMVEDATAKAILALVDRRTELAEEVKQADTEIDAREVRLEEDCLKVLAVHQPVAADLRFTIAVLKVNNDLERVGDLAGNIASRAAALARLPAIPVPEEITQMAEMVQKMLRDSLNAVVAPDTDLARQVLTEDGDVDDLHKEIFVLLEGRMKETPETLESQVHLLSVSRYLERIADLATNIAEDVVFMVEGDVVRHLSW